MESNSIRPFQPQALNVPPLNSMPYVDPVASMYLSYESLQQGDAKRVQQGDAKRVEPSKPALLYFSSQPSDEEWHNLFSVTNNGIGLSGSAAAGAIGPLLGKIDIGESEESYIFRVSLPGVAREDFTCDITPDGQILIKGVTTTGEKIIYKNSLKFEMQSQNLCPPGLFSISFKLPGPVDSQQFSAHFGIDGVFEGLVKKKAATN